MGTSAEDLYKQAGLFSMIGGILGLVVGSLLSLYYGLLGISTFGIGCVCCLHSILILAVGGAQLYYGLKVKNGEAVPNIKNMSLYLMIGSFVSFHVIGGILELLAYMNYGKPEVDAYIKANAPQITGG